MAGVAQVAAVEVAFHLKVRFLQLRMRTPCPKPSLLNYESGHSRLATGFEKQPVKFEFRFFILAGSYAAFAAIDAEKSYFSIRPQPAGRGYVSICSGGPLVDLFEWPLFGEQIDDFTAATWLSVVTGFSVPSRPMA